MGSSKYHVGLHPSTRSDTMLCTLDLPSLKDSRLGILRIGFEVRVE